MGVWVVHMLSTREDVGELRDTPANMVPGADSACDTQRCSQSDKHFAEETLLAVSMRETEYDCPGVAEGTAI